MRHVVSSFRRFIATRRRRVLPNASDCPMPPRMFGQSLVGDVFLRMGYVDHCCVCCNTQGGGELSIRWMGASCGDSALDNNPKVNKPANEKVLAPSAGVKTPHSDREIRTAQVHAFKAECAQVVRDSTVANDEIDNARMVRDDGVMPGNDEGADDAAGFEEELETLLDRNAEVFRRLAQ